MAWANGAFPDEFSIHFPPGAPSRILIGANFGLLVTEDAGATWRYSCEPWVVLGSSAALSDVPVLFYQVTADGSALLAAGTEITRSTDTACTWPPSTGLGAGPVILDMFASPTDASLVFAAVGVAPQGGYIVASHDGGKTFDAARLYETTTDLLTGIESSRSQPSTVYATSLSSSGTDAKLLQSTSSGAAGTWTPHSIPTAPDTQPRIMAVDPADANTVYLRVLGGTSDAVVITTDGGRTFQDPFTIRGQLTSFLRATDGTLYAGTINGELYVRKPGANAFDATPLPAPHLRCLGQRFGEPKRVYACGDMVVDGYSLYFSDDGGKTFTPVMKFTQLQGPLACAPVQTNCAAHWNRIQGVLGIGSTVDGGQTGGGGGGSGGGGSHCASAGVDLCCVASLFVLLLRRKSRSRKRPSLTRDPSRHRWRGPALHRGSGNISPAEGPNMKPIRYLCAAAAAAACSGGSEGPTGGPVSGAQDVHCRESDGGVKFQHIAASCVATGADAGTIDYGPTMYNAEADDDDCKYHLKFTNTAVRRNENVNFTVTATVKETGAAATSAKLLAEVYLNDTHPAPNTNQKTSEQSGGNYVVGPIQFDAAGQWTVRFHLREDCSDEPPDSPHGHAAFFISVP